MALDRKDSVADATTTVGTGTLTLTGISPIGFRPFSNNITDGATVRYRVSSLDLTEWEDNSGVWDNTAKTLTRGIPSASSNAGNLVSFSAGTKFVTHCISVADFTDKEDVVNKDASGGYVGKTLEKINFWNAARTFKSFLTTVATAARTWTFPDKDGTVAMTNDLVATSISNTPAGNIAATTVQGAINELDAEKLNKTDAYFGNDIINGQFRVAQIGTSFVSPASGTYDLDGWVNENGSAAVFTVAQFTGSSAERFARYVTITTADASVAAWDFVLDDTRIEGYNIVKYVGNTFTISFRAKVPVVGIHCVALRSSNSIISYVHEINFPTANVWQDCSFTVVGGLPTAGTWNYANGVGLFIGFIHMCGSAYHTTADSWNTGNFLATANQVNDCDTVNNVWALENVTMNLGTVAAVSEISYEQELARCQRYLPCFNLTAGQIFAEGFVNTAVELRLFLRLPTSARVPPTGVYQSSVAALSVMWPSNSGGPFTSGLNLTHTSNESVGLHVAVSGAPVGYGVYIYSNAANTIYLTGCRL